MNTKRIMLEILGWTALFAILLDWIPYFVQMLLYFIDIKSASIGEYIMVAMLVLSPGITIFLAAIGKKLENFNAFIENCVPIVAIIIGFLFLFEYGLYYQLLPSFIQEFTAFNSTSEMVGMIGIYTPTTNFFFLLIHALIFGLFLPILLLFLTHGTGRIGISIRTIFGLGLIGLFMVTRIGGISGTLYRMGLLFIGIGAIFIFLRGLPSDNMPVSIYFGIEQMPHFGPLAFLILIMYLIASPSSTMNGLPTNSIVWITLSISSTIVYFLTKKNLNPIFKIGQVLWIIAPVMCILTILSQMIGILISIQIWLLSINLLLVPFLMWSFQSIIPQNYDTAAHRWLNNSLRQDILLLFMILSALFPYLGGVSDPISDIALIGIICVVWVFAWLSFKKAGKKAQTVV